MIERYGELRHGRIGENPSGAAVQGSIRPYPVPAHAIFSPVPPPEEARFRGDIHLGSENSR